MWLVARGIYPIHYYEKKFLIFYCHNMCHILQCQLKSILFQNNFLYKCVTKFKSNSCLRSFCMVDNHLLYLTCAETSVIWFFWFEILWEFSHLIFRKQNCVPNRHMGRKPNGTFWCTFYVVGQNGDEESMENAIDN